MPTNGLDLGERKTYVAYLTAKCDIEVLQIGHKDAWLRMCGKHWIVQAHNQENAFDKAWELWLEESGVSKNAPTLKNVVIKNR